MSQFISSPASGGGDNGGDTSITDVNVGYIRPDGDDVSGDGSPGKPFATAQAAFNNGFFSFDIGDGDAGNIQFSENIQFWVRGRGAQSTLSLQSLGSDLQVVDVGFQSVGLAIDSHNGIAGSTAGSVILYNCLVSGTFNASGDAGDPDVFGNGGTGATVQLFNCLVQSEITALGGAGVTGDDSNSGSSGGNGGTVQATYCQLESDFVLTGGAAGSDGGAGAGTQGADGQIVGWLSTFSSSPPGNSGLRGCVVSGAFIATQN